MLPSVGNHSKSPMQPSDFSQNGKSVDDAPSNPIVIDDFIRSLMHQGEKLLFEGDFRGLELFEKCIKIAGPDAGLLLSQGCTLLESSLRFKNLVFLRGGSKRFKEIVFKDPTHYKAWHLWGVALFKQAAFECNPALYDQACIKLENALKHISKDHLAGSAELLWDQASCRLAKWRKTKDAEEITQCLSLLKQALAKHPDSPCELYCMYATVLIEAGRQRGQVSYIRHAYNTIRERISKDHKSPLIWKQFALASWELLGWIGDGQFFIESNHAFTMTLQQRPTDGECWLLWSRLLHEVGVQRESAKLLQLSLEKARKALECDPNSSACVHQLAISMSAYGAYSESLFELQNATRFADELVDSFGWTHEVCYTYGLVLKNHGIYFHDVDFLHQAIEKFQEGVALDRSLINHWIELGDCYQTIADFEGDAEYYDTAVRFYHKALKINPYHSVRYNLADSYLKWGELLGKTRYLEASLHHYEWLFEQRNSAKQLPLYHLHRYAVALDSIGVVHHEASFHQKALNLFSQVLMQDPQFPRIHYSIALCLTHLGDCSADSECFRRSLHHYRIAHQQDEESDRILLDWGIAMALLAQAYPFSPESTPLMDLAEYTLKEAIRQGSSNAYYHLAGIYSLTERLSESMSMLEKCARLKALPPNEEILSDDWFDKLRDSASFEKFLADLNPHSDTSSDTSNDE